MELSLSYSSPKFPTFHGIKSRRRNVIVSTKINCSLIRRCSQYRISPPSKNGFQKLDPHQISYGRKTIPLLKAKSHQSGADKSNSPLTNLGEFYDGILQFIRPQFLYGTVLAFAFVMTRTWMENAHLIMLSKWVLFVRAIIVLVTLLSADGFVNGINQIYDIEIDRINKPHYPLVSGKLSLRSAWTLVINFLINGIANPVILKSGSLLTYVLGCFLLGSLYSIPPFSTKRSTVGAILTCASLRGYMFPLGLLAASRTVLGLPFQLSPPVIFMAIFCTMFTLVCGALKDIEDVEGDIKYKVPTLVSIHGPKKVAFFGFGLILLTYVGAIITAILMPQVFRRSIMIPAHGILACYLISQAWKLEKANYTKEASRSIYQSMWKLMDMEFILFLFI